MDAESQLLAELKRRIEDAEEAIQRQDNALIEKDAEIERLKALITELADALDRCDPIQISIQEVAALVQRAREATR